MSQPRPYPKKLFYRINEVSEIVGVEPYVLRYWESKFKQVHPERFDNEERRYRRRDIEMLLRIRTLLYDEKYTIAGATEKLKKDPTGAIAGEFREPVQEPPPPRATNPGAGSSEGVLPPTQIDMFLPDPYSLLSEARAELARLRSALRDMLDG